MIVCLNRQQYRYLMECDIIEDYTMEGWCLSEGEWFPVEYVLDCLRGSEDSDLEAIASELQEM